jgi:hypothetical protein
MGLVSLPAIDSLQEFKVESVNVNAEYRNLGTVTLVTKAGTNQFHGEAYEFNENKSLNANSFLLNAAGKTSTSLQPKPIRRQCGRTHLAEQGFFFFDYAGLRQVQSATVQLNFPSSSMRRGDFTAWCASFTSNGVCADPRGIQLYNPFTDQPFPSNQIPSSMIASQAQTLLKFVPAPTVINSPGLPFEAPNYLGLVPEAHDLNAADLRIDYQLSDRDSLYGVYSSNVGYPWAVSLGGPPSYGNASDYGYKTFSYSLVETHTFSPTTVNYFRVGWFDHLSIRSGQNLDCDPRSLFPQLTPSPNRGLPTMNMQGYTSIGDTGKGFYGHAPDVEFTENLTHIHGGHTIKMGVDEAGYKEYNPNPNAPLGTFTFNGQWTGDKNWPGNPQSQGNAFADFLLGVANTSVTGFAPTFTTVNYSRDVEFYAQDT